MAVKDFTEHYCLVVYAQDKWKERYEDRLSLDLRTRFFELSSHYDCKVCNSCPVCRAIEEMFDPSSPGEYDLVCGLCERLVSHLRKKLGKADGLILFSHYRPMEKDLIEKIFEERRIKKVYVLHLKTSRTHRFTDEMIQGLKEKVVARSDFLKGPIEDNIILEIRRDEYMR